MGWSVEMGLTGFQKNGKVWRDDKIVFAWSKFKSSGKKCPADVEYKRGPGKVNVEDLVVQVQVIRQEVPGRRGVQEGTRQGQRRGSVGQSSSHPARSARPTWSTRGGPARSTSRICWSSSLPSINDARKRFRARSTSKPRGAKARLPSKICSLFSQPSAKNAATNGESPKAELTESCLRMQHCVSQII